MTRVDEEAIGARIRLFRERAGLSVTELANRAGLSKSTVSKIEKGRISSPISTLIRIAQVMDVPVAEFLVEPHEDPPYVLTRRGEGMMMTRNGSPFGYSYEALAPDMQHKLVQPFILTIQPDDPESVFRHEGQEFIHVLSGRLVMTVDGDEIVLRKGDSLYFDSGREHRMRAVGKLPARFIDVNVQEKRLV